MKKKRIDWETLKKILVDNLPGILIAIFTRKKKKQ